MIALKLLSQVKAKSVQAKEAMDHETRTTVNLSSYKGGKFPQNHSSLFLACHISNTEFSVFFCSHRNKKQTHFLLAMFGVQDFMLKRGVHTEHSSSCGRAEHPHLQAVGMHLLPPPPINILCQYYSQGLQVYSSLTSKYGEMRIN